MKEQNDSGFAPRPGEKKFVEIDNYHKLSVCENACECHAHVLAVSAGY